MKEVLPILKHIEDFLVTHKAQDLVKVYGPDSSALGDFLPESVDFFALPWREKAGLQSRKSSALRNYRGFGCTC